MTNTSSAFKKISGFLIVSISACSFLPSTEQTPYTEIQPAEIYYYTPEDTARKNGQDGLDQSRITSAITNPTFTKGLTPNSASRAPFSRPKDSTAVAVEYRKIAAEHIYKLYRDRVYKGVLPPFLQAIGVVQVRLDKHGRVVDLQWLRRPKQAPERVNHTEALLRNAAPYPLRPNQHEFTFTETWLWHENGQFQLRSLTEGQSNGESEKISK